MSLNGTGDAAAVGNHLVQEHQAFLEAIGSPARVSRNGLAFVVAVEDSSAAGPTLSLDTSITRPGDAIADGAENTVTAEQISEKLAAAEARREAAMNDLRNKCSEESSKIEKARLQRESEVAEVKDAHQAKMDQASANLISMREAMLDKLKKEDSRQEEVRARQAELQERLGQLDKKYIDKDGKRNAIIVDLVEKSKEHNDKVKAVRDAMMAEKERNNNINSGNQECGGAISESNHDSGLLKQRYSDATMDRDAFFNSAEARLQQENFHLSAEETASDTKRD